MFIGVDVGTQSVRASLVDKEGATVNCVERSLICSNPKKDYYEQDCCDIWGAVCFTVKSKVPFPFLIHQPYLYYINYKK